MTKFSAALILAACLAAPAARADDKDKPDPWKTFTSKEGKYSVLLPGMPQQQKQPGDPPKGRPNLYIAVAALDTDRVAYVIHGDYPDKAVRDKGAKAFLDAQTKGSVTSLKGKLLSEKTTPICRVG